MQAKLYTVLQKPKHCLQLQPQKKDLKKKNNQTPFLRHRATRTLGSFMKYGDRPRRQSSCGCRRWLVRKAPKKKKIVGHGTKWIYVIYLNLMDLLDFIHCLWIFQILILNPMDLNQILDQGLFGPPRQQKRVDTPKKLENTRNFSCT